MAITSTEQAGKYEYKPFRMPIEFLHSLYHAFLPQNGDVLSFSSRPNKLYVLRWIDDSPFQMLDPEGCGAPANHGRSWFGRMPHL